MSELTPSTQETDDVPASAGPGLLASERAEQGDGDKPAYAPPVRRSLDVPASQGIPFDAEDVPHTPASGMLGVTENEAEPAEPGSVVAALLPDAIEVATMPVEPADEKHVMVESGESLAPIVEMPRGNSTWAQSSSPQVRFDPDEQIVTAPTSKMAGGMFRGTPSRFAI